MLDLQFERVIISHGEPVHTRDPRRSLPGMEAWINWGRLGNFVASRNPGFVDHHASGAYPIAPCRCIRVHCRRASLRHAQQPNRTRRSTAAECAPARSFSALRLGGGRMRRPWPSNHCSTRPDVFNKAKLSATKRSSSVVSFARRAKIAPSSRANIGHAAWFHCEWVWMGAIALMMFLAWRTPKSKSYFGGDGMAEE